MKTETVVLASKSPRRKELLAMAGIPFTALSTGAQESVAPGTPPQRAVVELAERKARAAALQKEAAGKTVVGADTVVALGGKIFGKPRNEAEAFEMLSALSGETHRVFTGVCILFPERESVCFYEKTDVTFYPLAPEEIEAYISTGEPMDKAGAYGIQGRGALFVKRISGDFYNVVGLPVGRLVRVLSGREGKVR